MQKGQATIEFIFIILIILIYLFGVTRPLILNTQGAIEDVENITKTNYASQRLVDTINKISLLGQGSKETITVFIPNNSEIRCEEDKILFETKINQKGENPTITACENDICKKEIFVREGIDIDCVNEKFFFGVRNITIARDVQKIKIFES